MWGKRGKMTANPYDIDRVLRLLACRTVPTLADDRTVVADVATMLQWPRERARATILAAFDAGRISGPVPDFLRTDESRP